MKWMPIAFFLILAIAAGLRIPKLADRPLHHDEANQAYRFGMLLDEGVYEYDANEHHGPTLYYLTLPQAWLTGVKTFADSNEYTYRLIPVFFGLLLILCIPLLRSGIGTGAVLGAAFLTAISPGMAYYSRFYIQEIIFVFFTFMAIAAGWRSYRNDSYAWAAICGISAGLMFATKETAVITYAAVAGAFLFCMLLNRSFNLPLKKILLGLGCAVVISFLLFSSFFTNPEGPLDSILAFKGYFERGTGVDTDHIHPWNFYLKMLTYYRFDGGPAWSEALIFGLGLCGGLCVLLKKLPEKCDLNFARFILFYTLLLTAAYSLIAYKTPWCILSFLHGWIILAGLAIASAFESVQRNKWKLGILLVLLLACSINLTRLCYRTVFTYAADYRNPYVYAHTSPDFKNLMQRIYDLEKVSGAGNGLYIQVVANPDETWPLPFYLRNNPTVGYWLDTNSLPTAPIPDIIISAPDVEISPESYLSEFYGLRPDTLLAIHIDRKLWDAFIETRK